MTLDANSSAFQHGMQNLSLIALSFFFLPIDTFILACSIGISKILFSRVEECRKAARKNPSFRPRVVLVTGVGMTKGLSLARLFYEAGHDVIGADFEANGIRVCGRGSRALKKFVPLAKPNATEGSSRYIQGLIDVITDENIDLWVSCSGVASAVEDGEAKQIIEAQTSCRAIQFDVKTTQILHEKHTFIARAKQLGLTVPETYTVTDRATVLNILQQASKERKYIMKPIGMDDLNRGNMTLLPRPTTEETFKHISKLDISKKTTWILQQFIRGREFCTHSLVVEGHVKAFVACPSAELLMHYEALPASSKLSQEMLRFTQAFATAGGKPFTGHLSFDFLIEGIDLEALYANPQAEVTLYPIECNPRAHTAVALFNGTRSMTESYLSLIDHSSRPQPSYAETVANGTINEDIVTPKYAERSYYWVGHDLVNLLVSPLFQLITLQADSSPLQLVKNLDLLIDRLVFWKDGTYELWDPLPWWWLYHMYWPRQFLLCLWTGRKWSRINVSTCKMFEC